MQCTEGQIALLAVGVPVQVRLRPYGRNCLLGLAANSISQLPICFSNYKTMHPEVLLPTNCGLFSEEGTDGDMLRRERSLNDHIQSERRHRSSVTSLAGATRGQK